MKKRIPRKQTPLKKVLFLVDKPVFIPQFGAEFSKYIANKPLSYNVSTISAVSQVEMRDYDAVVVLGKDVYQSLMGVNLVHPDMTTVSYNRLYKSVISQPYQVKSIKFYFLPSYNQIVDYQASAGGKGKIDELVNSVITLICENPIKYPINYTVLDTWQKCKELLEKIKEKPRQFISLDIETNNTDYSHHTNTLRCVGLSIGSFGNYIIPISHRFDKRNSRKNLRFIMAKRFIKELYEIKTITWIAHNSNFDFTLLHIFFELGLPEGEIDDTLLIYHLLDETTNLDAKSLAEKHIPEVPKGYEKDIKEMAKLFGWQGIDDKQLHNYCVWDCYAELLLYRKGIKKLMEDEPWRLYNNIVKPINRILIEGSAYGIPIDYDKAKKVYEDTLKEQNILKLELNQMYRVITRETGEDFNPNSSQQVAKVIYEHLGYPVIATTPTGAPKTDVATLVELLSSYKSTTSVAGEFLEKYMYLKKVTHSISNYLSKYVELTDSNGYIHPQFKTAGARETGRVTSANPPFVNVSSIGDIKSLIKAPAGYTFIYFDYKQCEYVLFANFIQDEELLSELNKGADFHSVTGKAIFPTILPKSIALQESYDLFKGDKDFYIKEQNIINQDDIDKLPNKLRVVPLQNLAKELRKICKACNFGIIYGASVETTAKTTGMDANDIKLFLDRLFMRFPTIKKFLEVVPKLAEKLGFMITPFGRRKWFKGEFDNHMKNQSLNMTFQSGAQDVLSRTCVRISKTFKKYEIDGRFVNMVYDSALFMVKKTDASKAEKIIRKVVDIPVAEFGDVVLKIDLGIGDTWAEAEANAH